MPYPRHPLRGCSCPQLHQPSNRAYPPTEFTEFTEVSGRGYSPTDFTDAHRFLGCVFAPNLCTSVQSVGVFVGGYGILPYPRHPPRGCSCPSCTNQALVHQHCNPPTEFTDFTEVSGCVYSPTDFTDAHRLGGYGILPYPRRPLKSSHRIRRTHRSFWWRIFSHRFHRCTQMVRFCGFCGKIV